MSEKVKDKTNEKERLENQRRKIMKYMTRFIFIALLASGFTQIAFGLHLLTQCRNDMKIFMCGIMIEDDPCSKLAVPAYFGCAIILATIFGFGCVGRRSTGIIIFIILLAEVGTGIYFKVTEHIRVFYQVWGSLTDATEMCFTSLDSKAFKMCWFPMLGETPQCSLLKQKTEKQCAENFFTGNSLNIAPYENLIHSCTKELSLSIDISCTSKMDIVAVFMLVMGALYILISCTLVYLHRKDRKKGFGVAIDSKSNSSTDATENQDFI